jgi:hypothetical protein
MVKAGSDTAIADSGENKVARASAVASTARLKTEIMRLPVERDGNVDGIVPQ